MSLTSPDGSRRLALAINDDTITTVQEQGALAEVAQAALCS